MKFWRHFESVLLILQISNDGFRNKRTILNDFNDVIFNSLAHNRHWMLITRCGVDLTSYTSQFAFSGKEREHKI